MKKLDLGEFINDFASLFNDLQVQLTESTNFKEIEEWDSLVALSLIALVDEKYGIRLLGEDIRSVTTILELYQKLLSKQY
ncbi:MAG: acyl carrier protein [Cytophagales bacterium]|nr:acyl carrier protein [Bernardetiaceae bacterium]MDW8210555.1 acyl carrier protein [Cytophagales bacterium]